jgi:hypothetical protein
VRGVDDDELALACRLSGLSVGDLWTRYLTLGGSRSRSELERRLAGTGWPEREDRFLAVVADEALRECGLPRLAPAADPRPLLVLAAVPSPGDGDPAALQRTAAAVLETRTHGRRLTALFEQCAVVREEARGARERAEAFRRSRRAVARPVLGGR